MAAVATYNARLRQRLRDDPVNTSVAGVLAVVALAYPLIDQALGLRSVDQMFPIVAFTLLALGLNIVVGFAGLLDLGYAAFFAIGAYTVAIFTSPRSPVVDRLPFQLNFWASLVLAFFLAALFGVILGAPTLRLRGDYLAIVTLGFGEIVPAVFRNADEITRGEQGLNAIARPTIFGFEFGNNIVRWYYLLILMAFLIVFLARRLRDSRLGRAWMAVREDEIAASAMGIDLVRTKLFAFAMGASFSGLVGVIYASRYSITSPSSFEFSTSIVLLAMVILGGLGNIWGVILGGLMLGVFDRILSIRLTGWVNSLGDALGIGFLEKVNFANLRYGIFGLTLVLMMLLRPEGILPNDRRRAELHSETSEGDAMTDETLYERRGEPV